MHIEDTQNHGLTPDRYKMHTDTQEGEFISEEQEICMEDTQGSGGSSIGGSRRTPPPYW